VPSDAVAIEAQRFRHVLGHFPTGVVVATAIDDAGDPTGMAVGSFTSVSLDPALIAFLPAKSSTSFPRIRNAGSFCINVLADDQEEVCRAFATRGGDKFAGVGWRPAPSGAPVLDGVVAWIDCSLEDVLESGDHYIVLGRVGDLAVASDASPLLFFRGGYGQFRTASLSAPAQPDLLAPLRVADKARGEMERLASDLELECFAVASVGDELVTIGCAGQAFGSEGTDRIGQRMSCVPPLGGLFYAWADPARQREWLGRLGPGAEGVAGEYEAMLERIRVRGWSTALASRGHIAFELTLAEAWNRGDEADAEAVAAAVRGIGHASHEPDDASLETDALRIRNISAPVFDHAGEVVLTLTLVGLPRTCTRDEFIRLRDRLLTATDETTHAIKGRRP
jgi:flavin reductase (DIM6/NTAB) family NADH-FMN oxidoreductase RutF/DNA-binding IclR family transcriptional regulator